MINFDRIVPIQKIDRLSMIGEILSIANVSCTVLTPEDAVGNFEVPGSGSVGNFIANQPVKTLDFPSGVTAGKVYFIPALDFADVTKAGVHVAAAESVVADGVTLYLATLSSNNVTIAQITPSLS